MKRHMPKEPKNRWKEQRQRRRWRQWRRTDALRWPKKCGNKFMYAKKTQLFWRKLLRQSAQQLQQQEEEEEKEEVPHCLNLLRRPWPRNSSFDLAIWQLAQSLKVLHDTKKEERLVRWWTRWKNNELKQCTRSSFTNVSDWWRFDALNLDKKSFQIKCNYLLFSCFCLSVSLTLSLYSRYFYPLSLSLTVVFYPLSF